MYTQPLLNPKGLLTVFVSLLLSGHALAETAGRVNFVVGDVSAVSADGSRRVLTRGDLVNSGERLETGKGRLQIRFTDGSFISLQPNTVFGLDNYTFAKNKPNEGSLLFNFVRGSMRTVSGAIGKVNRANYKIQTPVATIGIRGTGYAATQEPNGRLLLTVSKGIVNLANNFGNSNVPAGQTFQIEPDKAPELAPRGVSVEARADTPEDKTQQKTDEKANSASQEMVAQQKSDKPNVAVGDQASNNGNPLFESFIQTTDGIPRLSSFGSLLKGTSGVQIYPNVIGLYDNLSKNGKDVGNLVGLIGTDETGGNTSGKLILETRNGVNSLQFANVQQVGSLSFGEWTKGSAKTVDSYLESNGLTLSSTQFMPYIVGTTAEKTLGNNLKASYRLASGTPLRAGTTIGTLSKLNIDIDLNLIPLVSVDMAANLANVNYTASVSKSPLAISFNQKFSGFILSAENNNLYAQSSNTSICANNKCPVDLSAFLSGNDMGAVYEIKRGSLSSIGGVAALTGTEAAITSVIPSADRLESSLAGNYTALFSTNTTLLTPTATNLSAVFDTETGKLLSAFHNKTASDGSLEAVDLYEPTPAVNVAAASTTDVGHLGKVLAWGMWSKGALALGQSDTNGQEITNDLTGNNNVHYMIGLPTNAAKLPSSGIITYQVKGGTIPQASFSTTINNKRTDVADVGTLNSNSQMVINFGGNTPNASLNMTLSGFTKASSLTSLTLSGTTNLTGNTLNFNTMSLSANAGNSVSCSKCSATGSFVGEVIPVTNASTVITSVAPQAIGLGYNISGTTTGKTVNTGFIVNGTAAFGNPTDTTRQGG